MWFRTISTPLFVLMCTLILSELAIAQTETGETAARQYFSDRQQPKFVATGVDATSRTNPRYMSFHYGHGLSDKANKWGNISSQDDISKWNFGLTYRMGGSLNTYDTMLRIDLFGLKPDGISVTKFSFLPVVVFPDSATDFPLYFGMGAGLGFVTSQIEDESEITIDYQLMTGLRFYDVFDNWGFFGEIALKNHFHLLSSGQFRGTFLSIGTVSRF